MYKKLEKPLRKIVESLMGAREHNQICVLERCLQLLGKSGQERRGQGSREARQAPCPGGRGQRLGLGPESDSFQQRLCLKFRGWNGQGLLLRFGGEQGSRVLLWDHKI